MRTTTQAAECTSVRCPAPACTAGRPTCLPGCPKVKAMEMLPDIPYGDIHEAPRPAQGCLDGELVTQEQQLYNGPTPPGPRTCPPGTKPIPKRPPGVKRDRFESDAFLDTFDCQEQPVSKSPTNTENLQLLDSTRYHSACNFYQFRKAHQADIFRRQFLDV